MVKKYPSRTKINFLNNSGLQQYLVRARSDDLGSEQVSSDDAQKKLVFLGLFQPYVQDAAEMEYRHVAQVNFVQRFIPDLSDKVAIFPSSRCYKKKLSSAPLFRLHILFQM